LRFRNRIENGALGRRFCFPAALDLGLLLFQDRLQAFLHPVDDVIASVTSLTAIIGLLVGTAIYAATREVAVGAVWFAGAGIYALTIPILISRRRELAAGT